MIALDFYSGSHGHFLEYIVNTYIFKGPAIEDIFTPLGTSHLIRKDTAYMDNRIVEARHYSEFNIPVDNYNIDKIIRISVDDAIGKVCYEINVNCRAGDIPAEKKNSSISNLNSMSKSEIRNIFYAKYVDSSLGYQTPTSDNWTLNTDKKAFEFPMSSMYNLFEFCKTLNQLSVYLEQTFTPDYDFYNVWQKFINFNHGFQSWTKCQTVFNDILLGRDIGFALEPTEEALLNVLFSEAFNIYSGPLYEQDQWPTNTRDVYKIIQAQLLAIDAA